MVWSLAQKKAVRKYQQSKKGKIVTRKYMKKWREKNKKKIIEYRNLKRRKIADKKNHQKYMKSEKGKKALKRYLNSEKGKKTVLKVRRAYYHRRIKKDYMFRLIKNTRNRLGSFLKSSGTQKKSQTLELIGCSKSFLKKYIENKFKKGMTWKNYGKWHIDHIHPLSKFDLNNSKSLKKACHYSNLQPMWAKDNIAKSNRVILKTT